MITDINQLDLTKRYTYADYLTWQFDEMVELIKGKIFRMSPAPNRIHQEISGNLFLSVGNYLNNKMCKVYHAPFDVRLPLPPQQRTAQKLDTVVQPDISVICDLSKLDQQGCKGAPDWIIEILSPATSQKDLVDKFEVYEHAGVQEYWIVHPYEQTVLIYHLNNEGKYQPQRVNPYVKNERVSVGIFNDFEIDLAEIFTAT